MLSELLLKQKKKKNPPLSLLTRGSGHQEVSELVKVFAQLTSKNGSFAPRSVITRAGANVLRDRSDEEFLRIDKMITYSRSAVKLILLISYHVSITFHYEL